MQGPPGFVGAVKFVEMGMGEKYETEVRFPNFTLCMVEVVGARHGGGDMGGPRHGG